MRLSIFLLICSYLVGCGPTYVQNSQSGILHEAAIVVETCYTPGFHHIDTKLGINGDGDLTLTPVSCSVPEQHAVVFRCQHGKFVIHGRTTWIKVATGDDVDVSYQELYHDTYDRKTKTLIKREVYDYHFIDCVVTNPERKL